MASPSYTTWPPYNGFRDCSQGICSMYCPQWCYMVFPPPPPPFRGDDSASNFSPLIIAVIGTVASIVIFISYYTIVSRYCKRRGNEPIPDFAWGLNQNQNPLAGHGQWQRAAVGLDESVIASIAVFKYQNGGGSDGLMIDGGSDCAVCLGEFQEGETLRLLPKCSHAFHVPCIDDWLRSRASCPLCRSNVVPTDPVPFQQPPEPRVPSSDRIVPFVDTQMRNGHGDEVVIDIVGDDVILPKHPFQQPECMWNPMNRGIGEIRRSSSLGSLFCENPNFVVDDIVRVEEHRDQVSSSSSRGENSLSNKRSQTMKRSFSTG